MTTFTANQKLKLGIAVKTLEALVLVPDGGVASWKISSLLLFGEQGIL